MGGEALIATALISATVNRTADIFPIKPSDAQLGDYTIGYGTTRAYSASSNPGSQARLGICRL